MAHVEWYHQFEPTVVPSQYEQAQLNRPHVGAVTLDGSEGQGGALARAALRASKLCNEAHKVFVEVRPKRPRASSLFALQGYFAKLMHFELNLPKNTVVTALPLGVVRQSFELDAQLTATLFGEGGVPDVSRNHEVPLKQSCETRHERLCVQAWKSVA